MHEPKLKPNPNPYTNSNSSSSSSTSTSSCSCHKRSSIRNQAHITHTSVLVRACTCMYASVSVCECLYKYSHNRICANHTYVHAPLCHTHGTHSHITCSNFSRKFITFRNYSTFVWHTTPRWLPLLLLSLPLLLLLLWPLPLPLPL